MLSEKTPQLTSSQEIKVIDMLIRYEAHKKDDATVQHNMKHLKPYFEKMRLSHVCNQVIREYVLQRQQHKVTIGKRKSSKAPSLSTIRRELDTLSAAFGFARREGFIKEAPFIEKPAPAAPRERWLTYEEFSRLQAAASGPLTLYLKIAIYTAARPSAIYALKWFQVDMKHRLIHFNPEGRQQTRKHRPSVAINDTLYAALKTAKKDSGYVLGGVKSLKKSFANACKAAKLKGVSPYTLRHTAITWAVQGGHSLANVGHLAGHKDPRTTMRYAKHDPSFTRAIVDTLANGQELAKKSAKKGKKRQPITNKKTEIQYG